MASQAVFAKWDKELKWFIRRARQLSAIANANPILKNLQMASNACWQVSDLAVVASIEVEDDRFTTRMRRLGLGALGARYNFIWHNLNSHGVIAGYDQEWLDEQKKRARRRS